MEEYKRAMYDALKLADLREQRGRTQREVAQTLATSQANVSRIEHEESPYLSTLKYYVAALGGRLEVRAVFPDGAVLLVGGRDSPDPAEEDTPITMQDRDEAKARNS